MSSSELTTPMGQVRFDFAVKTVTGVSNAAGDELYPSSGDVRDINILPGMPLFAEYECMSQEGFCNLIIGEKETSTQITERIQRTYQQIKVISVANLLPVTTPFVFMGISTTAWSPYKQNQNERQRDDRSSTDSNSVNVTTDGICSFVYQGTPVQVGDTLIVVRPRQDSKKRWMFQGTGSSSSSSSSGTRQQRLVPTMEAIEYQNFHYKSQSMVVDYECLFSMMRESRQRLKNKTKQAKKDFIDVGGTEEEWNKMGSSILRVAGISNSKTVETIVSPVLARFMTLDFKQSDVHAIMCLWEQFQGNKQAVFTLMRMLQAHMNRMLLYKKYITVGRALSAAANGDIIDVYLGKISS